MLQGQLTGPPTATSTTAPEGASIRLHELLLPPGRSPANQPRSAPRAGSVVLGVGGVGQHSHHLPPRLQVRSGSPLVKKTLPKRPMAA